MRVLTAIQPTGPFHLGNYFGMIEPTLKLMDTITDNDEILCFVANYHALTTTPKSSHLRANTLQSVVDLTALGFTSDKVSMFVQSELNMVTELALILSNVLSVGQLQRCHAYKDKVESGLLPNMGLFSYPLLMAADILLYDIDTVIVGKDQTQHLEIAKLLVKRFNSVYGNVFREPKPLITDIVVAGIDGRKMSKSYDNTIEIFCDKDKLAEKIKKIPTSTAEMPNPQDSILYKIYAPFLLPSDRKLLVDKLQCPSVLYKDIKSEMIDVIYDYFAVARERRKAMSRMDVYNVILEGTETARHDANHTMKHVKGAVGLDYMDRLLKELRAEHPNRFTNEESRFDTEDDDMPPDDFGGADDYDDMDTFHHAKALL